MRKKNIIISTVLIMLLTFTNVMASDIKQIEVQELTLEDAIKKAQSKDKRIKNQKQNIEYAKYDSEEAYEDYNTAWDMPFGFDEASVNYSVKLTKASYEKKMDNILHEKVAYETHNLFDSIIEMEQKLELAKQAYDVQKIKLNHMKEKEKLGLASKHNVDTEKATLDSQAKEIDILNVTIDAAYRQLNDKIGGSEPRYKLIKENIYEPLEMKRTMAGQISYAIDSDPNIWFQEESTQAQERLLGTQGKTGYAPTYAEYQKRKLGYEKGLNDIKLNKEMKEQQIKGIYENILALESQYAKLQVDLDEMIRKNEILKVQKNLGLVTDLSLKEASLGIKQIELQMENIIRNHNKLKILFEKSYLETGGF